MTYCQVLYKTSKKEKKEGTVMNLYRARMERNLTQQAVADATSISLSYYSLIERGKRRPSPEVAQRLAIVFGMPERWTELLKLTVPVPTQILDRA